MKKHNHIKSKNNLQNIKNLWLLILFYCVAMIFSNWFDIRLIKLPLIGIETDAGTLIFPFTFIISSIITEVYGYKNARWAIWCGLAFNAFGLLFGQLITQMDSPNYANNQAFDILIKKNSLIIIASTISYIIAEPLNSYLIAKLKVKYAKFIKLRFFFANSLSTLIDSAIFSTIAFGLNLRLNEIFQLFFTMWGIKLFIGICMLYFANNLVKYLKEEEKIDIYDKNLKFSIFSLDTVYLQLDNHFKDKKIEKIIDNLYIITSDINYKELHDIWQITSIQNQKLFNSFDEFLKTTEFSQNFCLINHTNHAVCGYARIITDYTKYASICEVIIDEKIEDKSLEKKFIAKLLSHKTLKNLTVFKINNSQNKQVNMEVLSSPKQPLINDANINEIKIMEKQVN